MFIACPNRTQRRRGIYHPFVAILLSWKDTDSLRLAVNHVCRRYIADSIQEMYGVLHEGWYDVNYNPLLAVHMKGNPVFNPNPQGRIILDKFQTETTPQQRTVHRQSAYLHVRNTFAYIFVPFALVVFALVCLFVFCLLDCFVSLILIASFVAFPSLFFSYLPSFWPVFHLLFFYYTVSLARQSVPWHVDSYLRQMTYLTSRCLRSGYEESALQPPAALCRFLRALGERIEWRGIYRGWRESSWRTSCNLKRLVKVQ